MMRVPALLALVVLLTACAADTLSPPTSTEGATRLAGNRAAGQPVAAEPGRPAHRVTGLVWKAARLRAGPAARHATVGRIGAETRVRVLATRDTWYRVRLDRAGASDLGWIPYDRVVVEPPLAGGRTVALGAAIARRVNLRQGPSTSTAVLARLAKRTPVSVLGREGNWYRVSAVLGAQPVAGWVRADFAVVDVAAAPTVAQARATPSPQAPGGGKARPRPAPRSKDAESNPLGKFLAELGAGPEAAAASHPGLESLAPAGGTAAAPAEGCGGSLGGTWESASGRTILDLDAARGTGVLKSHQARYRAITPFTWSATFDSITLTYTGPTRFYEPGTGRKVDFEKHAKGGTVHCAFSGDTLSVGGVAYRRR